VWAESGNFIPVVRKVITGINVETRMNVLEAVTERITTL
jgi:hypothetical protein